MKKIILIILSAVLIALSSCGADNTPGQSAGLTDGTTEAPVTTGEQTDTTGEQNDTAAEDKTVTESDTGADDTRTATDVEGYLSAIDTSTLEGAIRKAYLSEHRTLIESGDADLIGADVVYSDEDAAAFFITGMAGADIPSYEVAGERYFIYGQSRYLLVYRDGAILHINTAYDTDVISGQFLEAVYSEYRAKNPSLYEDFDKEGAAALADSIDITYKEQ